MASLQPWNLFGKTIYAACLPSLDFHRLSLSFKLDVSVAHLASDAFRLAPHHSQQAGWHHIVQIFSVCDCVSKTNTSFGYSMLVNTHMHNNMHPKHIQDNILLATSKVDFACRHKGHAHGCMQRLVVYRYGHIHFSNLFQITSLLIVSTRNHLLKSFKKSTHRNH